MSLYSPPLPYQPTWSITAHVAQPLFLSKCQAGSGVSKTETSSHNIFPQTQSYRQYWKKTPMQEGELDLKETQKYLIPCKQKQGKPTQ